jgi:hypothetical protein
VDLQVAEPAQRGAGVSLVREPKGYLMVAEAIVTIEQAGELQAMDG